MAARKTTGADDVAQLTALLPQGGRGRGRCSPLVRWLRTHHDAFQAMLVEQKPGWEDVATALAGMGLRDGDGKPPTGERTRKAWWGVRRGIAQRRTRKATALPAPGPAASSSPPRPPPAHAAPVTVVPAVPAPAEIAPSVHLAPPAEVTRSKLLLELRPAIPLSGQVLPAPAAVAIATEATSPAAATDQAPQVDVQATVRRLEEQMRAGKVPLPKIVD